MVHTNAIVSFSVSCRVNERTINHYQSLRVAVVSGVILLGTWDTNAAHSRKIVTAVQLCSRVDSEMLMKRWVSTRVVAFFGFAHRP